MYEFKRHLGARLKLLSDSPYLSKIQNFLIYGMSNYSMNDRKINKKWRKRQTILEGRSR